jgi:hypothetical protein
MLNLTSPAKAGFTRLRGRPKQPKYYDGGTIELQKKRRRVREILADDAASLIFSWLHIAHRDETINQDLFDLGSQYSRLRSRVLRSMQNRSLKLGCHAFTRHLSCNPSPNMEKRDERTEEFWYQLLSIIPADIIHTLDEFLFENVDYNISSERISSNKKRLKKALIHLSRYKDYL